MHQPKRARVDVEPFSKRDRLLQARPPELPVHGDIVPCQNPQRDLRSIAVESASQEASIGARDANDGSRFRSSVPHVAAIHPEMAILDPLLATGTDGDGLFHDRWW